MGEVERVTTSVIASLLSEGYRVRQVVHGAAVRALGSDRFEANLSDPASVRELHKLLAGTDGATVGAVLNFLPLCDPYSRPGIDDPEAPLQICRWTFNALKEFEDDLEMSAHEEGGWLFNLTGMGGKFGVDGSSKASLSGAGTLGIAKSFMRECPKTRVVNVDVDPSMDPNLLAGRLAQELAAGDDAVEIGWSAAGRYRLKLNQDESRPDGTLNLDKDSVVLVTGGAYGVTADVAKGLARKFSPRLVLVGRSPLPEAEGPATQRLDAKALRTHLIQEARSQGAKVLPAEIEKKLQRMLRNRQILENIEECRSAGSEVEYHALDARDPKRFGGLLDDLYTRYGKIDGVIHGAGVIDDKKIRDKSPESFEQVFSTKVDSALILARKLRPETVKFLVFFSSVSGRFGNAGQTDYSAANEFLNKLADWLDARWPGRVSAINWGPWDGGMVSDELRRMYAQVGFQLIPIDVGVGYFLDEIQRTDPGSSEVVVSASVASMAGPRMS